MKPSLPFNLQNAALAQRGSIAGVAAFPAAESRSARASIAAAREPDGRRTKVWQLGASLHCSIIGACRADAAFFPVDCISHDAAQSRKRLCQQAGKPFIPLRSSGTASLLQALRALEFDAAASRHA